MPNYPSNKQTKEKISKPEAVFVKERKGGFWHKLGFRKNPMGLSDLLNIEVPMAIQRNGPPEVPPKIQEHQQHQQKTNKSRPAAPKNIQQPETVRNSSPIKNANTRTVNNVINARVPSPQRRQPNLNRDPNYMLVKKPQKPQMFPQCIPNRNNESATRKFDANKESTNMPQMSYYYAMHNRSIGNPTTQVLSGLYNKRENTLHRIDERIDRIRAKERKKGLTRKDIRGGISYDLFYKTPSSNVILPKISLPSALRRKQQRAEVNRWKTLQKKIDIARQLSSHVTSRSNLTHIPEFIKNQSKVNPIPQHSIKPSKFGNILDLQLGRGGVSYLLELDKHYAKSHTFQAQQNLTDINKVNDEKNGKENTKKRMLVNRKIDVRTRLSAGSNGGSELLRNLNAPSTSKSEPDETENENMQLRYRVSTTNIARNNTNAQPNDDGRIVDVEGRRGEISYTLVFKKSKIRKHPEALCELSKREEREKITTLLGNSEMRKRLPSIPELDETDDKISQRTFSISSESLHRNYENLPEAPEAAETLVVSKVSEVPEGSAVLAVPDVGRVIDLKATRGGLSYTLAFGNSSLKGCMFKPRLPVALQKRLQCIPHHPFKVFEEPMETTQSTQSEEQTSSSPKKVQGRNGRISKIRRPDSSKK